MAIFDNLFGTQPEYLSGLLGADEAEKLRKQAMTTGLVNSAIALIAQPRNQRFGSALPYIGRALMAGQQAGQGVYNSALQGLETQQKLAEFKRKQEQLKAQEQAISQLPADQQQMYRAYGEAAIPYILKKPERKTATVGNVVVDTETGQPIFTAPQEAKPRATREVDAGNKVLIVDSVTGETVREIPKGLAPQAPKAPQTPSYSVQTDASGNAVYVPNVPGLPALDMSGKPTTYKPAPTAAEAKVQEKQAQAKKLPVLINEAERLIKDATGSYLGAAADIAGRAVGYSTEGAKNIASLKALEANLVLNMPRLEGPQSNLDQQLYREAAAQIGDPTVPAGTKQAALDTIKRINTTYGTSGAAGQTEQIMPKSEQMPKQNLSVKDRQALQWANNNPNDPRAQQIKQRLGR